MAGNTLTNLIPDLYQALDVVSRELVGFIPSVTLDANVARAAIGQTIYSFVAPAATASDIAPGAYATDEGEQNIGSITLAVTKSRKVPVKWQGEESRQMNTGGFGVSRIRQDQFAQAMRTLCNEIESDLAGLYKYGSRAVVPTDTSLFKTDLKDAAAARKVLMDNGAPTSELRMVIDTSAGANLRGQATLSTVLPTGQTMATQGVLINASGFDIRESGQISSITKGTAASATVNASAYAVGATEITLANAGTGDILAGDIISFANDPNFYVVKTGCTGVASDVIVLAAPGLRQAIEASAAPAITVRGTGTRGMAFARSAILLATRVPAAPDEGDMADDVTTITDPKSGLSFEVRLYRQYRQIKYEIGIAWGTKVCKTEHVALMASV